MQYDESAVELVREALIITLKIAAPILLAGLVVGLIVSLLQSVTSIQDQTLSFVPKIVVMVVAAILLIPWIAQRLVEYAAELFEPPVTPWQCRSRHASRRSSTTRCPAPWWSSAWRGSFVAAGAGQPGHAHAFPRCSR